MNAVTFNIILMKLLLHFETVHFGQYLYFKILFKSVCALLLLLGANLQVKFGAGKIFGQRAEN